MPLPSKYKWPEYNRFIYDNSVKYVLEADAIKLLERKESAEKEPIRVTGLDLLLTEVVLHTKHRRKFSVYVLGDIVGDFS